MTKVRRVMWRNWPQRRRPILSIVGAVAVIGVVTGLLVNVKELIFSVKELGRELGIVKEYCDSVDVNVRTYAEMPFYLDKTIKYRTYRGSAEDEVLYWVFVTAENRCVFSDVVLNVTYSLLKGHEFASLDHKPKPVPLPAGMSVDIFDDPNFFFTNPQALVDGELEIKWEVFPIDMEDHPPLRTGTRSLIIKPKSFFPWNWKDSDGTPVKWRLPSGNWETIPKIFLLASLAAWTKDTHRNIADVVDDLDTSVALENSHARDDDYVLLWIKTAYEKIYKKSKYGTIAVVASTSLFPAHGTDIRLPSSLLGGDRRGTSRVHPLESALMLGALASDMFSDNGTRFGLILLPKEREGSLRKRVYFVWWKEDGGVQALEIGNTGTEDFGTNLDSATQTIRTTFENYRKIGDSLTKEGVYYIDDVSILALDFSVARTRYGIRKIQ